MQGSKAIIHRHGHRNGKLGAPAFKCKPKVESKQEEGQAYKYSKLDPSKDLFQHGSTSHDSTSSPSSTTNCGSVVQVSEPIEGVFFFNHHIYSTALDPQKIQHMILGFACPSPAWDRQLIWSNHIYINTYISFRPGARLLKKQCNPNMSLKFQRFLRHKKDN